MDGPDIGPNPRGSGLYGQAESTLNFVDTTAGSENLHLTTGSIAFGAAADLSALFTRDIDFQPRSVPWDVGADELPPAAAPPLIAYSDFAAAGTRPLQFTTYSGVWAAPGTIAVTGSPPFHNSALHQKVATTSPSGAQRAVVWSEHNPGTRDYLFASFWDGTNWDDGTGAPFGDAETAFSRTGWDGTLDLRSFDAAYEQLSGRLLVAYGSNPAHTLRYRRYDSGVWSADTATTIPAAAFGPPNTGQDGYFTSVRLAARPGTNQIAVLNLEAEFSATPTYGAVTAAIWDGDTASWGSKATLSYPTTNGQNGHLTEAGDIKFVLGGPNAGEAIAVWGNGQQVYSARWSQAGGWSVVGSIGNLGGGNTARWIRLAAQPQGDRMVVAVADTNQGIRTIAYDATTRTWASLSAYHTTTAYGNALYNRSFDVVFDPAAGADDVLIVYSDTTRVRYRTSSNAGIVWTPQQSQDGFTVRQAHWVQLARDPSNVVHFAMQDAADALQVYTWDGTLWRIPAVQVSANTERGTNHSVEPFAVASYPPQGAVTTAVELMSFSATGADATVDLAWRTGSELNNLGFHLHRSLSEGGPWTRITPSLIPGLGSSPEGASYSFRDTGLTNGVRYFYRLEDIDSEQGSTFHGPVSAVPAAASPAEEEDTGDSTGSDPPEGTEEGEVSGEDSSDVASSRTYGRPEAASFRVVSRTKRAMVVELRTPGFVATETPSGVKVSVPGFDERTDPRAPDLPLKRVVLDAVVGRHARIVWVKEKKTRSFPGLRPAAVGSAEIVSSPDGTVRPRRRSAGLKGDGLVPRFAARIPGDAFIGENKKLALELSPLRYDAASDELRLARRLRVKIAFDRKAASSETGHGSRGRRRPRSLRRGSSPVLAHLHTQTRGLHAVSFETLFPQGHEALPLESLRLSRQGDPVPVHVEPQTEALRARKRPLLPRLL